MTSDLQVAFTARRLPGAKFKAYIFDRVSKNARLDAFTRGILYNIRKSYLRYGREEILKNYLLDQFEDKSFLVIIQAKTECDCRKLPKHALGEWFSMRFVPGGGKPAGFEDLELCTTASGSLSDVLRQRLLENDPNFLEHIVSITRICITDRVCDLTKSKMPKVGVSCLGFWTANLLFTQSPNFHKFKYVMGLFHNDLISKGLTNFEEIQNFTAAFTPAYKTLGFTDPTSVRLSRNSTAYKFPRYYFDHENMSALFKQLVMQGRIDREFARETIESQYQHFGQQLSCDDVLPNSDITGKELRDLVDARVGDAPDLKIMQAQSWSKRVSQAVEMLGVRFIGR